MKLQNILIIPVVFAAGILSVVLLQSAGLIHINASTNANTDGSQEALSAAGSSASTQSSSLSIDQQNGRVVAATVATGTSEVSASMTNERLSERIDELQQQLRSATLNADLMQSKIDQLDQQLESATTDNAFLPSGEGANSLASESTTQTTAQADRGQANRRWGFNGLDSDEQYESLVAAGVDRLVAEEFKKRSDQWALQRLELVDQATREGWRRSEQFGERMTDLREERPDIRAELGDERYDRYLYESGEFNRVQVFSIIDGSAAQAAGMENGDIVLSYANQRMFTSRDLQQATSAGSRGELVPVNLLRNGESFTTDVPRGPLGVSLTGTRLDPSGF